MVFRLSNLGTFLAIGLAAYAQGPGGQPGHQGQPNQGQPNQGQPQQGWNHNPGWRGSGQSAGSPAYTWIFQYPLPIPSVIQPSHSVDVNGHTIEYYEITIEDFESQVYPNLGPAHLTGYNGVAPGPAFHINRGVETVVRVSNKGSNPAAMHLHGSPSHAPWDGWADDLIQPNQYKDYYYPNTQAGPLFYHDHVDGATSVDVYYGQFGVYTIYDPGEDALGLPSGDYDIPLSLTDKVYQSNGDLVSPAGNQVSFYGDIIQVNEQPWPYLNVEPRKYRFRLYDLSLSRPYNLYFADEDENRIDFQIIASDGGLFEAPVDSQQFIIGMGERYEVVIDFASFKGSNVTLMNDMQVDVIQEFGNTDKVMRFVVGNTVSDNSNNGAVPSSLNTVNWPVQKTTVDHVFNFQHGGDALWTINGEAFNDVNNRVLARPPQGSTELWQVNYVDGPGTHPVHIHLVNFQIVSRSGSSRAAEPYESAGLKDVVLLEPGESAQVLAFFGPWNGVYMFHCHNLIHEDALMMDAFNVTLLEELGYEFNDTYGFIDPTDSRFKARAYDSADFQPAAITSTLSALGNLNAYAQAASLAAAETAYYATAAGNDAASTAAPAPTGSSGQPSGGSPPSSRAPSNGGGRPGRKARAMPAPTHV